MSATFAGYLARRFLLLAFTLVLVPSLSFLMFTTLGGGDGNALGRLWEYLQATFVRLDFGDERFQGETFIRTRGVLEQIGDGFPVDTYLLVGGIVMALVLGLTGGAVMALRPRSSAGRAVTVFAAIGLSMPVYFLGLVALLVLGPKIGRLVAVPFLSPPSGYRPPTDDPIAFLHAMWVPWLVVATPLAAACARMTAALLAELLEEEFIRTARAKGIRELRVLIRHALPPASIPVAGLIAVNMNLTITNVALVEAVFNIPGSFRALERAMINRDVDFVQGMVLEATFLIVVANFLADAYQAWLDPRVRRA